jgi:hypothetical protein
MSVIRGIAVAALFGGLAIGTAASAWADPVMSGHYIRTDTEPQSGRSTTADWYFTPCGDGCASVADSPSGKPWGQAHLVNGQWAVVNPSVETKCPDGTNVPNANTSHYTRDPSTLAGKVQVTERIATCGATAPESWTNNLQLTKAA